MSERIDPRGALEFIHKNAPLYAAAKANERYLTEYRKSLKSSLMLQSTEKTAVLREAAAYADPAYIALLEGLKAAVEESERLRWQLIANQAATEIWRTQSANDRNIDRAAH
jgi:hypothetical protein